MSISTTRINGRQTTVQTFNRFGQKKQIVFYPDSALELSMLARAFSGKVLRMTREEYMELEDATNEQ